MHEMIGRIVGQYRILKHLGSGGMGVVFLAERADEQFRKQVAIKLVTPSPGGARILERFRLERHMLAALDHPNIVKLLDAGTTDDGLPYLIMDYVDGIPIIEYCASRQLNLNARLQLFRSVCAAVHYAHQNLLIHRDIKPTNLLVTGDGIPKLLDFGIAKLLPRDLDETIDDITGMGGLRPMTLKYASPEQLRGEPLTIATDIYSLGILLYELLTGGYPYPKATTPVALFHAVSTTDPEKPSAWLDRMIKASPAEKEKLQHCWHCDLRSSKSAEKLKGQLQGDLDAIIIKAIDRNPLQRYASAEHLSEDLRRHLARLPISVNRAKPVEQIRKFILRNKTAAAIAALFILSLLGGMLATLRQAKIAEEERRKASQRFNDVRQLANTLMFDLYDAIVDLPGSTSAQKILVQKASAYLDKLAGGIGNDQSLQIEIAEAYLKLGDVQGNPYQANLGDSRGAIASYEKALASIGKAPSGDPRTQRALGQLYQHLSDVQRVAGNRSEAESNLRRALQIFAALAVRNPNDNSARIDLARCYDAMGDLLLSLSPDNSEVGTQALDNYGKSLLHWEAVLTGDLNNYRARRAVSILNMKIGEMLADQGDFIRAGEKYRITINTLEELSASDSTNVATRRSLALAYRRLGSNQAATADKAGAEQSYAKALTILETLSAADPANVQSQMDLAVLLRSRAAFQNQMGDSSGALASFSRVLAIIESLTRADPASLTRRGQLSEMLILVGKLKAQAGQAEEGHRLTLRGLAICKDLAERPNSTAEEIGQYALALLTCEPAQIRNKALALRAAKRAVEISKSGDAATLDILAQAYFENGDAGKAIETADRALRLLPELRPGAQPTKTHQAISDHLALFSGGKR